jgi:hypothetical protein
MSQNGIFRLQIYVTIWQPCFKVQIIYFSPWLTLAGIRFLKSTSTDDKRITLIRKLILKLKKWLVKMDIFNQFKIEQNQKTYSIPRPHFAMRVLDQVGARWSWLWIPVWIHLYIYVVLGLVCLPGKHFLLLYILCTSSVN